MVDQELFPHYAKFLVSGLGGTSAAFVLHPLDFMKIRLQMSGVDGKKKHYSSTLNAVMKIYRSEGLFAFYTGGTATLLRQGTYTTTSIGIYTNMFDLLSTSNGSPSFPVKVAMGMFGGMCGGLVGTPGDLCLIRMVSDQNKLPSERFYYKNVVDALWRITNEEGVLALWRGSVPMILRAMTVHGSAMANYSQFKQILLSTKYFHDDLILYFTSSLIAGFITAVITLPIDITKTRLQNSRLLSSHKIKIHQTVSNIFITEGVFAFWKGFTPYFARYAPCTMLTLIFVEHLSYWYQIYVLGNKHPKRSL